MTSLHNLPDYYLVVVVLLLLLNGLVVVADYYLTTVHVECTQSMYLGTYLGIVAKQSQKMYSGCGKVRKSGHLKHRKTQNLESRNGHL